ncbi:hypothetical protein [Aeromonas schubertii]|uniref:Uncharacterized protein n=1 Tax=Aeromonas schubertii TaxID=652 RepID=A0A0S2SP97_9GAMM|nr:hypothetical protein [Aeromonas schubertii]ALP43508.1 hypothetical protein WL1483_4089 [Aeromonas schubertii]QCG49453.1 hypothetical protein E2P79_17910 [Aeromonas schubertii]
MKTLFHPIATQTALANLADLPHRIKAQIYSTKPGPEGRHLREQARQQLRWHQLFRTLSRRTQP